MNARTEEIPISQITKDVIKSIGEELAKFSVGFVKLEQARQGEDATLAGSGTFVKAGEVYAILTAHHVIAELPRKGPLGLILSRQLPRHVVNVCDLERVEIARGSVDTEGPDIAALICSPNISGSLEARKSFFNLTSHRDQMLREPPGINEGIWILLGFVHQLSTEEAGPVCIRK